MLHVAVAGKRGRPHREAEGRYATRPRISICIGTPALRPRATWHGYSHFPASMQDRREG
jgi:hypothetical protein